MEFRNLNNQQLVGWVMAHHNFIEPVLSSTIRTEYIELCFKHDLKPCTERNLRYAISHWVERKKLRTNIKCINGVKEKIIFKGGYEYCQSCKRWRPWPDDFESEVCVLCETD